MSLLLLNNQKNNLKDFHEAKELAQLLRAPVVLAEDPSSVSNTHLVGHNFLKFQVQSVLHALVASTGIARSS